MISLAVKAKYTLSYIRWDFIAGTRWISKVISRVILMAKVAFVFLSTKANAIGLDGKSGQAFQSAKIMIGQK
jgi:hypothetical protein